METQYHGAAVLIALLGILPLSLYLRRRHNAAARPRRLLGAAGVSLSLLVAGIGVGLANGAL